MIRNYIISSAGRSGCHLLSSLIRSCGKNVVFVHNPFFTPADVKFNRNAAVDTLGVESMLVLLQRRDLFSAIMSMIIGTKTQQWNSYPNKVIPTFRVNYVEFENQYNWHKNYIQSCNTLNNYQQVKFLYFEDIVNDFNYALRQLELEQVYTPELPEKSPYSYQDIIENWDECKVIFDQLESNYKFIPILKKDIGWQENHLINGKQ